jgi:REP-associated tyrosine transposase
MDADRSMYRWRRMTPEQRREALALRQRHRHPWHGLPHYESDGQFYLLTAACYEHRPIIGTTAGRLAAFEADLLETIAAHSPRIWAWVVVPNHYHVLAYVPDLKALLAGLGQLHGRTSHRWNGEDNARGRHVWHRAAETAMKSGGHFWATVNYVLHNPVRHGYVQRWQDWPYSSASEYLEAVGREVAERRWREYPLLGYGDGWDPPDL